MKQISTTLQAHFAQEMTSLATVWTIMRRDGAIYQFSDVDMNFTFGIPQEKGASNFAGATFSLMLGPTVASAGFLKSNLAEKADLEKAANVQIDGILDSSFVTASDLRLRLWDYASVIVTMANWVEFGFGNGAPDDLRLFTGQFGPVTLKEYGWSVELRGLTEYLGIELGDIYQPACRVDLGSSDCGVNLIVLTQTGVVVSTDGVRNMNADWISADQGYFDGGLLTWLTGQNAGYSIDVKQWRGLSSVGGANASGAPNSVTNGGSGAAWSNPGNAALPELSNYVQPTSYVPGAAGGAIAPNQAIDNNPLSYALLSGANDGTVIAVYITNPGSGYDPPPLNTTTCFFTPFPIGSGGSGASGVVTVNSSGQVTGITITNGGSGYGGSGYTSPPHVRIVGDGDNAAATAVISGPISETWLGVPAGTAAASTYLVVSSQCAADGDGAMSLSYSLDGGVTWTNIYAGATIRAYTTDSVLVPVGTSMSQIQVRATADPGASGSVAQSIYSILIQTGSPPYASVAINQSSNSKNLICQNFGFASTGFATKFVVTFNYYWTGGQTPFGQLSVQLLKAGVPVGGVQSIVLRPSVAGSGSPDAPFAGTVSFPGSGLAAADINASGFGVQFFVSGAAAATNFFIDGASVAATMIGRIGGNVTLFSRSTFPISAGDTFMLAPGCDKLFSTCKNKFNNSINFRGEPNVPTPDHILDFPDIKVPYGG